MDPSELVPKKCSSARCRGFQPVEQIWLKAKESFALWLENGEVGACSRANKLLVCFIGISGQGSLYKDPCRLGGKRAELSQGSIAVLLRLWVPVLGSANSAAVLLNCCAVCGFCTQYEVLVQQFLTKISGPKGHMQGLCIRHCMSKHQD